MMWRLLATVSLGSLLLTTMETSAFQVQLPGKIRQSASLLLSLHLPPKHPVRQPQPTTPSWRLSATTYVNVEENPTAQRDIGTLEAWAQNCGVQRAEGFQLTSDDGVEWSAMTSDNLPQGAPVVAVSNEMIFSAQRARQELNSPQAEDLLNRLGVTNDEVAIFYLVVKVLVEYEKGDESPWFPWLNAMPRWFDNGAAMTPYCYECLPPLTATLAMAKRSLFIYFKDALQNVPYISDEVKRNADLMKWAYNVVITRSFPSEDGDLRMVPLVDMFNHGTDTEVDVTYDDEGNCYVYTNRDVPAGSPLRMSYGDPTNPSQLLATYGFLDESSPATFCKIMNITPSTELKNLGLDFSRMIFYHETGEASEEVWDVLLYSKVLKDDRNAQQAFYQAHMNGDTSTKQAIHQQFFGQTLAVLRNHVDTFLKDLEELTQIAITKDPQEHPRIPLILRHNEFVKTTFLTVQQRLQQMAG